MATTVSRPVRPLLVVAAWEPELRAFRAGLRALGLSANAPVCATVGVGAVEAAIGAARAVAEIEPRALLLLGTAGVYPGAPPALEPGRAAVARRLLLASGAVARGESYLPPAVAARVDTDRELRRALRRAGGIATADVACPLAITRSRALGRRLAGATRAQLETLEAFAVARVAATAGIPFAAVLGISNRFGPAAHAEWTKLADQAAAAAADAVLRWLDTVPRRGL